MAPEVIKQIKDTMHDLFNFLVLPLVVFALGWFGYRTLAACDECNILETRFSDHETAQKKNDADVAEALKARALEQKRSEERLAAALKETNAKVQEQFSETNKTINKIDRAVVRIEAKLEK